MTRKRIQEYAKEWGVRAQAILAQLEKIGVSGKKPQSALTSEEAEKVKVRLGLVPPPTPQVGKERLVAERVVVQAVEGAATSMTTKEQVIERRVGTGVIRRRTTRTEVPQEPIALPPVELSPVAVSLEAPRPQAEVHVSVPLEAAGPSRILGRIDLRKTVPVPPLQPRPQASRAPETPAKKGAATVIAEVPKTQVHKRKVVHLPEVRKLNERETSFLRAMNKGKVPPKLTQQQPVLTIPKASKRVIKVTEVITVGELAKAMGVKATEAISKLLGLGMRATINQTLDVDTATLAAAEFGYTVDNAAFDVETLLSSDSAAPSVGERVPRAPVVTVMGHVDHGKTSLLDAIRHTNVTARETGGITQHIGAYEVEVNGRKITFLDTPGHEAFTAMRARGARVTDIVVLVVAADDGVMPQTIEAMNHARAAGVPFVVALTKIDKPEADVERVKKALASYRVVSEEWGGDTIFVPVSAKTGEGIPVLLDMLLLQADVLELTASLLPSAKGTVIEAKLEKGRGPVTTVLVQEGVLKVGDSCVCGTQYGRVRALFNSYGQRMSESTPAMPVEVLGLTGVPAAGETLVVTRDDIHARQVAEHRQGKQRVATLTTHKKFSLADLAQTQMEQKELRLVLKADVQGSIEALSDALQQLSTNEVKLNILHASVGGISESDVLLAAASHGLIVGFHVRPEAKAAKLTEREGIEIRLYKIIYEVLADVRAALEGLLTPVLQEKFLGRVEVRQVFTIPQVGVIAGSVVKEGKITRGAQVRLLRDWTVVYQGRVTSLRRFKDDVREVLAGYECGVGLEHFQDIKAGDMVEAFEVEQVTRRLEPRLHSAPIRLSA